MDAKDQRIDELEAENAQLRAEIQELRQLVQKLTEKLAQNSRNSHLPPSSDRPGLRKKKVEKRINVSVTAQGYLWDCAQAK